MSLNWIIVQYTCHTFYIFYSMRNSHENSFDRICLTHSDSLPLQLSHCRICLESCQDDGQPFCRCRGTLRHVHEQCLLEWINRNKTFKDQESNVFYICELCKSKIYLEAKIQCKIRTLSEVCLVQDIYQGSFACLGMSAILSFMVMVLSFSLYQSEQYVGSTLIITSSVSAGLTVVLLFLLFLKLCMKEEVTLTGVKREEISELKGLWLFGNGKRVANQFVIVTEEQF